MTALSCPKCGSAIDAGTKFCINCGSQVPITNICPKCHWPIEVGEGFCSNCGQTISTALYSLSPNQAPVATSPSCRRCNSPVDANEKFCTNCGQPITAALYSPSPNQTSIATSQNCPRCHSPLEVGEKFCTNCGYAMQSAPSVALPQTPPTASRAAQKAPDAKLGKAGRGKERPLALVLRGLVVVGAVVLVAFVIAKSVGGITRTKWTAVSAHNSSHTVAIKTDGTLWAWGAWVSLTNGDRLIIKLDVPAQVGYDKDWATVSAGSTHTAALKIDGTLWAWGGNSDGQLGDGTQTGQYTPAQVGSENDWAAVSAGSTHTAALKKDGTIWAWGRNDCGQLGDGTKTNRVKPVQVGSSKNWAAVSAGSEYTVALKADGTLWAWGNNSEGQLGDGTKTNRGKPVQIGTSSDWADLSAGSKHTAALKKDGTLWAWGRNDCGQLGDGTKTDRGKPVQVGSSKNWADVSAASWHTAALKTDGTLWAWGNNNWGQLGDGTTVIYRNSPVQVGTAKDWATVSAGKFHTAALKTNGTLWAWGSNSSYQLGDGTTINRNSPIRVGEPRRSQTTENQQKSEGFLEKQTSSSGESIEIEKIVEEIEASRKAAYANYNGKRLKLTGTIDFNDWWSGPLFVVDNVSCLWRESRVVKDEVGGSIIAFIGINGEKLTYNVGDRITFEGDVYIKKDAPPKKRNDEGDSDYEDESYPVNDSITISDCTILSSEKATPKVESHSPQQTQSKSEKSGDSTKNNDSGQVTAKSASKASRVRGYIESMTAKVRVGVATVIYEPTITKQEDAYCLAYNISRFASHAESSTGLFFNGLGYMVFIRSNPDAERNMTQSDFYRNQRNLYRDTYNNLANRFSSWFGNAPVTLILYDDNYREIDSFYSTSTGRHL